jgi:hypothetical protein
VLRGIDLGIDRRRVGGDRRPERRREVDASAIVDRRPLRPRPGSSPSTAGRSRRSTGTSSLAGSRSSRSRRASRSLPTVESVVALGRLPHETGSAACVRLIGSAVAGAIERSGLGRLVGRDVRELSLGERQLVLLAVAIAQAAPVIVLDEPTVHLDVRHQFEVMDLLADLNTRDGRTIVTVIHDLHLAASRIPRIVVVGDGRIVGDGPPRTALSRGTRPGDLRGRSGPAARRPVNASSGIHPWLTSSSESRRLGRGHPLAEVVAAVAFLTARPGPAGRDSRSRTGAAAFGLVGATVGALAAVPLVLVGAGHPLPAAIAAIGPPRAPRRRSPPRRARGHVRRASPRRPAPPTGPGRIRGRARRASLRSS